MAIWTKNFKIGHIIIMAVSVLVVNSKYAWFFIVAASITLINQFTCNHCFSYSCERRLKRFFRGFINTRFGAIFTIFAGRVHKFFVAMIALKFLSPSPFQGLTFIITLTRTIFGFIYSTGNMLKFVFTYCAMSFNLNSLIKSFALIAAKFSRFFSIISDRKFNFAVFTYNLYSISRAFFPRRIHNAT